MAEQCRARLEAELGEATSERYQQPSERMLGVWTRNTYTGGKESEVPEVETGVPPERLSSLLLKQADLPPEFKPHAKIAKILEGRREMAAGRQPLDWAAGEARRW